MSVANLRHKILGDDGCDLKRVFKEVIKNGFNERGVEYVVSITENPNRAYLFIVKDDCSTVDIRDDGRVFMPTCVSDSQTRPYGKSYVYTTADQAVQSLLESILHDKHIYKKIFLDLIQSGWKNIDLDSCGIFVVSTTKTSDSFDGAINSIPIAAIFEAWDELHSGSIFVDSEQ